jgi:phenylacetate-CoA ligase
MAYAPPAIQSLFDRAPIWAKVAVASVYQRVKERERFGTRFRAQTDFLERTRTYDAAQAKDEQARLLERFLAGPAIATYARALGIALGGDPFEVLRRFPIIERQDLRRVAAEHRAPQVRATVSCTSGTTGSPLCVPISRDAIEVEYAFVWNHRGWRGITREDRIATVAGHPVIPVTQARAPFWIRLRGTGQMILSSYHLRRDHLRGYLAALHDFRPDLLHGYPSSLDFLAQAALELGIRPFVAKAVYTGSETLMPFQRSRIEAAFGVRVSNWYGNTEQCANIVECPDGRLHLRWEHSHVEIDEAGRLICTAFHNDAVPIVRYRLADVVVPSDEQSCPCGHSSRMIESIDGRIEDYILGRDGTRFGRLDHIFKRDLPILEARLVQERPGSLRIEVVEMRPLTPAERDEVNDELRRRVGPDFDVEWRSVPSLPRGATGKLRFIERR